MSKQDARTCSPGPDSRTIRTAEGKVQDPDAKARLATIGMNLTVMHWNLRQNKILDAPKASSFYLPDLTFFEFLKTHRGSLALHPTKAKNKTKTFKVQY